LRIAASEVGSAWKSGVVVGMTGEAMARTAGLVGSTSP
jgi:hypothetical protein